MLLQVIQINFPASGETLLYPLRYQSIRFFLHMCERKIDVFPVWRLSRTGMEIPWDGALLKCLFSLSSVYVFQQLSGSSLLSSLLGDVWREGFWGSWQKHPNQTNQKTPQFLPADITKETFLLSSASLRFLVKQWIVIPFLKTFCYPQQHKKKYYLEAVFQPGWNKTVGLCCCW